MNSYIWRFLDVKISTRSQERVECTIDLLTEILMKLLDRNHSQEDYIFLKIIQIMMELKGIGKVGQENIDEFFFDHGDLPFSPVIHELANVTYSQHNSLPQSTTVG